MKDTMQEALAAQAAWIAKWPHHCKTCEGVGMVFWEERHDQGYPGEPMQDVCDACIGVDLCPRCGEETFPANSEGECPEVCSACGWKADEPDYLPPIPEDDPQRDLEY